VKLADIQIYLGHHDDLLSGKWRFEELGVVNADETSTIRWEYFFTG
jgi:hypothetical protein